MGNGNVDGEELSDEEVGGCTGAVIAITETVFDLILATYMSLLLGLYAIPHGKFPTAIVLMTVLVELSITETLSASILATYMLLLLALNAIPPDTLAGTLIVLTTVLEELSITETVYYNEQIVKQLKEYNGGKT